MKSLIEKTPIIRPALLAAYRLKIMSGYLTPQFWRGFRWIFKSRETTNFTYQLTPTNKAYLCETLSLVTGIDHEKFASYLDEIENDQSLRDHVLSTTAASGLAYKADTEVRLHKRIGWYALVRAMKPKVVVETGVDKGLGSVVLCCALLRNREEGHPGHYYGTDLNPQAGYLLKGTYAEMGEILYGDSLESLQEFKQQIDIFINDSDHSAEYEAQEYEAVIGKLSLNGVILGDNSHATDKLMHFSHAHNRHFLFWKEEPLNHWYPGGGIGYSWK